MSRTEFTNESLCGLKRSAMVAVALVAAVLASGSMTRAAAAPVVPWISNGPPAEDILSFAIDPVTPGTIYAGAELGRIFKSTDGGLSWGALDTGLLMGVNALVIIPDMPNTIYAGTQNGAFFSTDAGRSWMPNGLDAAVINALVLDQGAPPTLYAGVGGGGGIQGVFQSGGDGQWTPISGNLPDTVVNVLALDPQASGTLYAATDAGVFRTTNRGANWVAINTGLPDATVNAIALDPLAAVLYAGTDIGVYVSHNRGDGWQIGDATFANTVSSIVIDQASRSTLYAGTFGAGVFVSSDGGASWSDFNNGLTSPIVRALAVDPGPPLTLFAGTIGDGVYFTHPAGQCLGDCDGSGDVTVNEIIALVRIDLGDAALSTCPAADPNNTGSVNIVQIIAAVNNALQGCSPVG